MLWKTLAPKEKIEIPPWTEERVINTMRALIREELFAVFKERPGSSIEDLDHAVLAYLSRVCKVHEEHALGNKVDEALTNALNTHASVHQIHEAQIKRYVAEVMNTGTADVKFHWKIPG